MSVTFTRAGKPVSAEEVKEFVAPFAINGYTDVPYSNLRAYIRAFATIGAAQMISANSWTMIEAMRAAGFDWHREAARP